MTWQLPDGWTKLGGFMPGDVILQHPAGGYMTVSPAYRNFKPGQVVVNQTAMHRYNGRSWRDRLFNDAIAALKEIYKDEQ